MLKSGLNLPIIIPNYITVRGIQFGGGGHK
jgi:hypothetical protein